MNLLCELCDIFGIHTTANGGRVRDDLGNAYQVCTGCQAEHERAVSRGYPPPVQRHLPLEYREERRQLSVC